MSKVPWANARLQRDKTPYERFHEKYTVNTETGCWEWQAGKFAGKDRGFITIDGTPRYAYRVSYELHVGPIPEGLVIDHLCNVPCCVNPDHLQAVTQEENRRRQMERQTHCRNGHPLSGENLALVRVCRTCRQAAEERHRPRKRRAA
jgi:hypothetical protein